LRDFLFCAIAFTHNSGCLTYFRIHKLLIQMQTTPKVLFIGLTTVDIHYFIEEFPLPNQKLKTKPPILCAGGPAANAAIACSVLGIEAHLVTSIGDNPFASLIENDLEKYGVKIFDLKKGEEFTPTIATVIANINSGERSILTNHPSNKNLNANTLESINIKEYSHVFVDGFYAEAAIPICKLTKALGTPILFDGGSWKPTSEEMLDWVDVAICSNDFFPPKCTHASSIFHYLQSKGVKEVAISRGHESILWKDSISSGEIPIKTVQAIDSSGAGDILHGAFTAFYAKGNCFQEALHKASRIATESTRFLGAREWIKSCINVSFD
jgi:sugar/nucleoside kinase (ribokinase family)